MSRKIVLSGAAVLLTAAALLVKWRVDVGTLAQSRTFAELRLADKFHIDMARTVSDLDAALVEIDGDIAELDSLWFVPSAEKDEVRQKWQSYRELVAQERTAFGRESLTGIREPP